MGTLMSWRRCSIMYLSAILARGFMLPECILNLVGKKFEAHIPLLPGKPYETSCRPSSTGSSSGI